MNRSRPLALLALVGSMVLFASSFTLTKVAYRDVGPFTLGVLRFAAAAALLWLGFRVTGRSEPVARADARRLAIGGLLGVTAYFALENLGVSWSTAADAALLGAAYPAIIVVMDVLLNGAVLSRRAWTGIGLAMTGAVAIVGGAPIDPRLTPRRLWGDLLILASAVVWGFYTFVSREVVRRHSPLTTVMRQGAVGALGFLPLVALEVPTWRPWTDPMTTGLAVAGLTVLCSIGAMALYTQGMRHLPTHTVAASINLMPVFGLVIAAVVLHERVSWWQLAGGAVVVAGVLLTGEAEPAAAEHPVA